MIPPSSRLGMVVPALLLGAPPGEKPNYFQPSGLFGSIAEVRIHAASGVEKLPRNFRSRDISLREMSAWSLRHLNLNPRPDLNYEPVFFIRPLHSPVAPTGHDAIVPGDTDARMDWEYPNMREILGVKEPGKVEKGLHARVLGYLRPDGLAWVPPGHYMEGDVYAGKKVDPQAVASTWASCKILRSLSEKYKRHGRAEDREKARRIFLELRKLADWDSGRAYYPAGSGAWLDGKWIKAQLPTALLEPVVSYWEATKDPEAMRFARAVAEGLLADAELLPPANSRILPSGEFRGHMHATMHGVWGVAHLGAVLKDTRFTAWAKRVYDYASRFGPGTGWMQAALWDDPVRELSETCATSDMVSVASWIAQAGFPEYWDHVERALRNYLRPQQFFVTAEYEALYRKLNSDKPQKEIEAGLARMRELQGAVLGGPGPNDWINWIASAKGCGPYATPYGCMSMFGCCAPEGMRALHTVWSGIVKADAGAVYINMTLNRKSSLADVVSSLPDHGRIDVTAHKAGVFYIRPPAWAPRGAVRAARGGVEAKAEWAGDGLAYLRFANTKPGEVLTVSYPMAQFRQTWGNWPSRPDLKLTISWLGNSVTDMQPRGKGLPIDFANLPPIPAIPE